MNDSATPKAPPSKMVQPIKVEKKVLFYAFLSSLLMTVLFCIFLTLVFFRPSVIFNFGFVSKYFITNPSHLEHVNSNAILPLISNGTIMTLNDLWGFQNSLYQTIITVLIGVNAVLATLSFFMIRNSSANAAREEAINEVERHIDSQGFNKKVKKSIHKKLKATEIDFGDLQDQIEILQDELDKLQKITSGMETEHAAMKEQISGFKGQINSISSFISKSDQVEDEFEGALLEKGEAK